MRIVCQQTILMKYHTIFFIVEKAPKFEIVVCCKLLVALYGLRAKPTDLDRKAIELRHEWQLALIGNRKFINPYPAIYLSRTFYLLIQMHFRLIPSRKQTL